MSEKMKEFVIENLDENVKDRFKRVAVMRNIEKDIGGIAKSKKEKKVKKVVEEDNVKETVKKRLKRLNEIL